MVLFGVYYCRIHGLDTIHRTTLILLSSFPTSLIYTGVAYTYTSTHIRLCQHAPTHTSHSTQLKTIHKPTFSIPYSVVNPSFISALQLAQREKFNTHTHTHTHVSSRLTRLKQTTRNTQHATRNTQNESLQTLHLSLSLCFFSLSVRIDTAAVHSTNKGL